MFSKLFNLFRKSYPDSVEFDYTAPVWGNALHDLWNFDQKKQFGISGHTFEKGLMFGRPPKAGDTFLIKFTNGKVGVLRVLKLEYCRDPHDMFHAVVKFEGLKVTV